MFDNYKFNVGDEVITTDGIKGKIVRICNCIECHKRGFYEPIWVNDETGEEDYISDTDAVLGFRNYYKIGKYRFSNFDRQSVLDSIEQHKKEIEKLERQLKVMYSEEIIL